MDTRESSWTILAIRRLIRIKRRKKLKRSKVIASKTRRNSPSLSLSLYCAGFIPVTRRDIPFCSAPGRLGPPFSTWSALISILFCLIFDITPGVIEENKVSPLPSGLLIKSLPILHDDVAPGLNLPVRRTKKRIDGTVHSAMAPEPRRGPGLNCASNFDYLEERTNYVLEYSSFLLFFPSSPRGAATFH